MPNWTTNAIACHKDALKLFVNDEGQVDFGLMRPMPESLLITSGGCQREAVKAAQGTPEEELDVHYPYKSYPGMGAPLPFDVTNFDELKALGEIYLENERMYGHQSWYGWSCDNWGTKWNACQTYVSEYGELAIVTFETAWSAPSAEMFDKAFDDGGFRYHAESFDEDFDGIYAWHGHHGLIYVVRHEIEEWDDETCEWDTGEYSPRIESIEKMLGI